MTDPDPVTGAIQAAAEPLKKLIDVSAAGIGAAFRPWQIRREARAHADANRVLTLSEIERAELLQLATIRMAEREAARLTNLNKIVSEAATYLEATASPEPVSEDWIARFFSACEDVNEERMRTLWAKILAGEVTKPNSFSSRTLSIVRDLSISEAAHFNDICLRSFQFESSYFPLIFDTKGREEFRQRGVRERFSHPRINYAAYQDLEAAGLIHFQSSMLYSDGAYIIATLESRFWSLTLSLDSLPLSEGYSVYSSSKLPQPAPLGFVRLSRAGEQLLPIAQGTPPTLEALSRDLRSMPHSNGEDWSHVFIYTGPGDPPWGKERLRRGRRRHTFLGSERVRPNPSLNRTRYGRQRKPGPRHMVHHLVPGLRCLP